MSVQVPADVLPGLSVVPSATAPPGSARLRLQPASPIADPIDGDWRPRSRQLSAELPELIAELSDRVGPVALVGYRASAWEAAPDQLMLAAGRARLVPLGAGDPATLVVVGADGRCLTLSISDPEDDDGVVARLAPALVGDDAVGAFQAHSLSEVVSRLSRLPGPASPHRTATISAWVQEAAVRFRQAPIQAFVPILVENIVRGRMRASASTW